MEKFRRTRKLITHPFGRHWSSRHCNVDRVSRGHRLFNPRLPSLRYISWNRYCVFLACVGKNNISRRKQASFLVEIRCSCRHFSFPQKRVLNYLIMFTWGIFNNKIYLLFYLSGKIFFIYLRNNVLFVICDLKFHLNFDQFIKHFMIQ